MTRPEEKGGRSRGRFPFSRLRRGGPCLLLAAVLWSPAAPLGAVSCRDCNVVLICVDTLRADRLGAMGYERRLTPTLDALAEDSFLFTNAVSPSAWTLPSIMSVFTSLYPHQHTVVNKYAMFLDERKELARLPPTIETLAELAQKSGYRTAAFTGGASVAGEFGFRDGFSVYYGSGTFEGFDRTVPMAVDWLKANHKGKFFLFLHGYDVHGQYEKLFEYESRFADPGYKGVFRGHRDEFLDLRMKSIRGEPLNLTEADVRLWIDRYDEQVIRADARLGEFFEALEGLGKVQERTVIVVFSDHGEEFYEHGRLDHGMTLYEELIHVPFILHVPGAGGRRIDTQVSTMDLMPTLADLLRLKVSASTRGQMRGTNLRPLLEGKEWVPADAYAETDYLLQTFKRSVRRDDGWKLIEDLMSPERELYHLPDDKKEGNNLAQTRPEKSYELERKLNDWMRPRPVGRRGR